VTTSLSKSTDDHAYQVAVQPDGKIIAVGDVAGSTDQVGLVRYNADGSLDASFGRGGTVVLTNRVSHYAQDVALQFDGKIVVADGVANLRAGSVTWSVYQFNANGTLDTGFGNKGQATVSLNSSVSVIYGRSPAYYYSYCRLVI